MKLHEKITETLTFTPILNHAVINVQYTIELRVLIAAYLLVCIELFVRLVP